MSEKTIFQKLVDRELPVWKVYEDEETFAFLDISPVNPGGTLVIPKDVSSNLYEISEESLCAVMKTVKKLAPAVKKATGADGINIHINTEPAAGQVITDHFHVHIIPRHENDGVKMWHGKEYNDEADKDSVAQKIIESISE